MLYLLCKSLSNHLAALGDHLRASHGQLLDLYLRYSTASATFHITIHPFSDHLRMGLLQ